MGSPDSTSSRGWEPPSVERLQALLPQYKISCLLGRGGMGAVYEGVQSNLDRKVAIKILPETLGDDEEGLNFTERFKLEAKSMASLDHPGIISVYDFGQTSEGQLYFVMEFIDGMDIHQYLKHHGGKLPPESAIAVTAHVLDALEYAHDQGIIHRDIKPANIMVKSDGRIKVADFGLVKRLTEGEDNFDSTPALTMTNMAIGTPDFVAPESLELGATIDHRADLYAVGVMFYQMLTGGLPRGNFRPPSGRVDHLDPRLDDIVSKALEADPEHRYANASAFRDAIDEILISPVPEETQNTGPVAPKGVQLSPGESASVATPPPPPPSNSRPHSESSSSRRRTRALSPVALTAIIGLPLLAIGIAFLVAGGIGGNSDDDPQVAGNPPSTQPPPESEPTPPKPNPKSNPPDSPPNKPEKPEPEIAKPSSKGGSPTTPDPKPTDPATSVATNPTQQPTTPDPVDPPGNTPAPKPETIPPAQPSESDPIAERLAEIDEKYRSVFEEPYTKALSRLNKQFTQALKREQQAASQSGNLDLVLAFQEESKQIGNGLGAGPLDAADLPPKLKQLRTTWHSQHQKLLDQQSANLKEANTKRDLALDLYQQELVKAQNIAAAKQVKALREKFAPDPPSPNPSISSTSVTSGNPSAPRLFSSPDKPVITDPPKLVFPPKRPERAGDLIAFDIVDESDSAEILGSGIVDFHGYRGLVLRQNGVLEVLPNFSSGRIGEEYETVAPRLSNIVSFGADWHGNWALASGASGEIIAWGAKGTDEDLMDPPSGLEVCQVFVQSGRGRALLASGEIFEWHYSGKRGKLPEAENVAQYVHPLTLNSRGRVTVVDSNFPQAYREEVEKVRKAVRVAFTKASFGAGSYLATLVLTETGEIIPIGWPEDQYPGGSPLPPDLPKDIEEMYLGAYLPGPGKNHKVIGGALSRSQGWFFFGESGGLDFAKLAERTRDCFRIKTSGTTFYALRDPAASPPTQPQPAPAAATPPLLKLPDPPEWLKKGRESGGKIRLWAIADGEPVSERKFARYFTNDDYVEVMTGSPQRNIIAARRVDRRGTYLVIQGEEIRDQRLRKIHGIDHRNHSVLAEEQMISRMQGIPWGDFDFPVEGEAPIAGPEGRFLYRTKTGTFAFDGERVRQDPEPHEILATEISKDAPTLIANTDGITLFAWYSETSGLRWRDVKEPARERIGSTDQPPERLTSLVMGSSDRLYGIGESGTVYGWNREGKIKSNEKLSPAQALRVRAGLGEFVQRPNGEWEFFGKNTEIRDRIDGLGPAIDLDISVSTAPGGKITQAQIVWIEPVD